MYFKDPSNQVWQQRPGEDISGFLPPGSIEITEAEADAIRAANQPAPTEADYSNAVQSMMDAKAQEHQYDGIQSAITYRGDANTKYAAEAEALFTWRSSVWTYATAQLTAVMAGSRSQPTVADFVTEVQSQCPFEWPA